MHRRQTGFTIIEVVVALTILSLLMLAMVSAMRTLGDTQSRLQRVIDRSDEMRVVSQFLRKNIGQSTAVFRYTEDAGEGTYFEGTASELVWVAPFSAGPSVGGLNVARLSLENNQMALQLQVFESPAIAPEWDDIRKYILAEQIDQMVIGYRFDIGQDWEEEWEIRSRNPRTVRILIKKEGRYWPELIIGLGEQMSRQR